MERKRFLNSAGMLAAYAVFSYTEFNHKFFTRLFPPGDKKKIVNLSGTHLPFLSNSSQAIFPTYLNRTMTVKLKGHDVKVHALCTGTVAVKKNFFTKHGIGEFAKINILLDQYYTDYLPIWVWVIEHPDGLIVIDTGESTSIMDIDKYLKNESAFLRYQLRHASKFHVYQRDELNYQLNKISLKVEDVNLVILTHLHLDHTDGLKFFKNKEVIIGDYECNHPTNNMPSTMPVWFKPNKVNYRNNRIAVFDQAYSITESEDLLYIATPGHTHGHSSVVLKTDHFDIIFAGDTSYNQAQVITGELAGVNADYEKSTQTYQKILQYASLHKTIYLPSHDIRSGERLFNKEFLV